MAPGDTLRVGQKLVIWTKQSGNKNLHPGAQGKSRVLYSSQRRFTVSNFQPVQGFGKRCTALERPSRKSICNRDRRLKLYVDVTRQAGV